jgi:aldehyde dehydrogenase (NAD+)
VTELPINAHPQEIWVDGAWVVAGGRRLALVNPATETLLGHTLDADAAAVSRAVAAARRAHDSGVWRNQSLAERIEVLARLLDAIGEYSESFAAAQTAQMGVPIGVARLLVQGTARMFGAYVDGAAGIRYEYLRRDAVGQSLVAFEPVGVVAVVIPWNGPLSSLVSKAVPALMMGCSVVLKPAPETPLEAGLFAELASAAGLPPGVFNVVTGGAATGRALVSDPRVDKVSFTGSTAAGQQVGEICGRSFTRMSLELGGKSAGIVLSDADIDTTVPDLVNGNFFNTGQICVALSRVLVPATQASDWIEALRDVGASRVVGDPLNPATHLGPLVTSRHRERVESFVAEGRASGARLVLGGGRPADLPVGWYLEPTIFADVTNDMAIARQEIFGPVMSVIAYAEEKVGVAIANDSEYGLHGAVFGSDPERALAVARRLDTGSVGVNTANLTPGTPYGGVGRSGIGREHGREGLESFLEAHSYVLPTALGHQLESAGLELD